MTLDTRIYVLDEADHREVFEFCRDLLGATEKHTWSDEQDASYIKGQRTVLPGNAWTIANDLGQGLPAWLMLHYRPDTAYRTPDQAAAHDEDCNLPQNPHYEPEWDLCDGDHYRRASWLEVSFDTAYGYQDDRGYGCGDLHAEYVARLGQWLDERGIRWEWRNEFTGEIHQGYADLMGLASGAFEASAWFRTSVLPVIERMAGESRG